MSKPCLIVVFLRIKNHPVAANMIINTKTTQVKIIAASIEATCRAIHTQKLCGDATFIHHEHTL